MASSSHAVLPRTAARDSRNRTPQYPVHINTTPEFWMNLQTHHDLAARRPERAVGRLRNVG